MSTQSIVLLVIAAALAGLVLWVVKAGHWAKGVEFLTEVRTEMRKVTFPARDEVVGTTIVVLITSFVFGVFLFASDQVIVWIYQNIVKVFS